MNSDELLKLVELFQQESAECRAEQAYELITEAAFHETNF